MKLSMKEKKILYAFACPSHHNTVTRLKWLTALTIDPEAIPLAAGHSIFKVQCLSARMILPKKEDRSRISKTLEKRLKSAYFHAYGIVL